MTDEMEFASSAAVIELIGQYAIVREIGHGGSGAVYACRDQELDRDVAIKLMRDDLLEDDVAVQRFKREGQVLAKIDSPHVVRVHQVGMHGKVPYLVMELVDGKDAETFLKAGPLPLERALQVARDIALGLAAAHEVGVLHRDIKPANVLLTSTGVKLTDFGLAAPADGSARLTQAGMIPGTAAFMSPERVRGASDARSDIYSLGCTLYALITGQPPFVRESGLDVIAAHLNEPSPRLRDVRDDVADFVDLMLYKDPERRPQTANDVAKKLDELIHAKPTKADLAKRLDELLGDEPPQLPSPPTLSGFEPIPMPPVETSSANAMTSSASIQLGDAKRVDNLLETVVEMPLPNFAQPAPSPDVDQTAPDGFSPPPPVARPTTTSEQLDELRMTGVTGSLARLGLAELLQTLEQSATTGCVDLRDFDGQHGVVGLRAGRLIYAHVGDPGDKLVLDGPEAFFALMGWKQGTFKVQYEKTAPAQNLDAAPQALMLEAFRRLDEHSKPPESAAGDGPSSLSAGAVPSQSSTWMLQSSEMKSLPFESAELLQTGATPQPPVGHSLDATIERSERLPSFTLVGRVMDSWRAMSPKSRAIAAGLVGAGLLAVLIGALAGDNGDTPAKARDDDRLQRIASGQASAVLLEVDAIPPAERKPVDDLVRGHALAATGEEAPALAAFAKAAKGGAVDDDALGIVMKALDQYPADDAIEVLVAWPGEDVRAKLESTVAHGDWWERHHALIALEKRKQDANVDVTALAIRDLREGPTCNKRKHGLTLLKERGAGDVALAAVDEAQKSRQNNCVWRGEWDATRRAIKGRAK